MKKNNNHLKRIEMRPSINEKNHACRIRIDANDKRIHIIEMVEFQKLDRIIKLILSKRKKISESIKKEIIVLLDNLKLDQIIELLNTL